MEAVLKYLQDAELIKILLAIPSLLGGIVAILQLSMQRRRNKLKSDFELLKAFREIDASSECYRDMMRKVEKRMRELYPGPEEIRTDLDRSDIFWGCLAFIAGGVIWTWAPPKGDWKFFIQGIAIGCYIAGVWGVYKGFERKIPQQKKKIMRGFLLLFAALIMGATAGNTTWGQEAADSARQPDATATSSAPKSGTAVTASVPKAAVAVTDNTGPEDDQKWQYLLYALAVQCALAGVYGVSRNFFEKNIRFDKRKIGWGGLLLITGILIITPGVPDSGPWQYLLYLLAIQCLLGGIYLVFQGLEIVEVKKEAECQQPPLPPKQKIPEPQVAVEA